MKRQAGHDHVFLCEHDPYRQRVLKARFPGVPVIGDIRSLGESTWRASPDDTSAPTDLWGWEAGTGLFCGGFPCQDLSVAGKRAGLSGERSGLFFEFARIVAVYEPRHVLIENVPGIFSSNGGRDFGTVLETLVNLGYGVAWRVLDSRYFGVPQRRRRVFILGTNLGGDTAGASDRSAEILAVGKSCGWHPKKGKKKRPEYSVASISGLGTGGPDDNDAQNARLVAFHLKQDPISGPESPALGTTSGGMGIASTLQSNKRSGYRYDADSIDQLQVGKGVRRLTPMECERLQGFPDDWTQLGDTADSKRYAALGDAVTVPVAYWLGTRLGAE